MAAPAAALSQLKEATHWGRLTWPGCKSASSIPGSMAENCRPSRASSSRRLGEVLARTMLPALPCWGWAWVVWAGRVGTRKV